MIKGMPAVDQDEIEQFAGFTESGESIIGFFEHDVDHVGQAELFDQMPSTAFPSEILEGVEDGMVGARPAPRWRWRSPRRKSPWRNPLQASA